MTNRGLSRLDARTGLVSVAVVAGLAFLSSWSAGGMQATDAGRSTLAPQAAQTAPGRPPAIAVPTLLAAVEEGKARKALTLARLDVQANVSGLLSRTRLTMTFRNDLSRILEGELVFPLPDGAALSGYALDVNGEMVDGVVVEKQEARIAFEKEVRRGVDPGLVEWVTGNAFRTRVFPIPAKGIRTVRVEYVSPLETRTMDGSEAALYRLPLTYRDPIASAHVRVEVDGHTRAPEVRGESLATLRFDRWKEIFVADQSLTDFSPTGDLVVALPEVARESVVVEQGDDGGLYFVVDDRPSSPKVVARSRRAGRVLILWDASLSAEKADREKEIALLEAWAAREEAVDVDFVAYRNVPQAPTASSVRAGNAADLVRLAREAPADGGTSLAALRPLLSDPSRYAYALLFGDGLTNLGGDLTSLAKVPVHAMSASSEVDRLRLRFVAESSGGTYIDLLSSDTKDALDLIGRDVFGLQAIAFDAAEIADVSPSGVRPVIGRLTVSGRLLVPKARLTLRYGGGGAPVEERIIELDASKAGRSGLVPRYWAQERLASLSIQPEANRDAILELGRRFSLVTPGTSLLVLETLQQHLEHKVEPPVTRKEMRAEYLRLVEERGRTRQKVETDKLDAVAALWAKRATWWETDHAKAAAKRKADERVARPRSRNGRGAAEARFEAPVEAEVVADLGVEEGVPGGVEGGVAGGVVGGVVAGLPEASPPPPAPMARPLRMETQTSRAPARASSGRGVEAGSPAEAKASDSSAQGGAGPVVVLKPWDPNTPYLTRIRAAGLDAYRAYLSERKSFGESPAFFLDCGDHLLTMGRKAEGVRILTSIAELGLEDARLYRIAAHRLEQAGEIDLAIDLFEKVLRLRPEEPQSLRDLALAYFARADGLRQKAGNLTPLASEDYLHAVRLLYRIAVGVWDGRFPEIEVTALMDLNRIASILEGSGREKDLLFIDPRLRKLLDVDVRVVMTWDTDLTDMDLWVTEPSGEKCFYSHPLTTVGGMISRDFTGGYGPEEYLVRNALPGSYRVQANFYGSRSLSLTGPTTVRALVITDFGRPSEKRQSLTLRLTAAKDVVDIGTVAFEPTKPAR